jgi:hypothetical protein
VPKLAWSSLDSGAIFGIHAATGWSFFNDYGKRRRQEESEPVLVRRS